jgi:hypothetical protein
MNLKIETVINLPLRHLIRVEKIAYLINFLLKNFPPLVAAILFRLDPSYLCLHELLASRLGQRY